MNGCVLLSLLTAITLDVSLRANLTPQQLVVIGLLDHSKLYAGGSYWVAMFTL